jgi:hypothetical protein
VSGRSTLRPLPLLEMASAQALNIVLFEEFAGSESLQENES